MVGFPVVCSTSMGGSAQVQSGKGEASMTQRKMTLRVCCAYMTVPTAAA